MKPYPLKALLAALAVETGSCFLPNSLGQRAVVVDNSNRALGPLFSTNMNDAPLDSSAVLEAYEEWRKKFGKGDFDAARFPNFENNYKVLTSANIKTKEQALVEGRAPPQWLDLNEYGDFSREEYQAMKQAKQAESASTTSSSLGTRPVRSTQVIKPPQKWGTQVVKKNESSGAQPGQPVRGTQVISRGPTGQVSDPPQPYWGSQNMQGTQKVSQDPNEPSIRGTRVVQKASDRGRQEVSQDPNEPSNRGTRVVQSAPDQPVVRGTQVIQKGGEQPPARPTQVVRPAASQAEPNGTQSVRGTQVIGQGSETMGGSNANRGTYVVRPNSQESGEAPRGTIVIPRGSAPKKSYAPWGQNANGDISGSQEPAEPASGRGTQVIKRNTPETNYGENPLSEFFGESGTGTQVIRRVSEQASSSIFSLFGGSKMVENLPETVRGTVFVEGDRSTEGKTNAGRPETVVVEKSDLQQIVPSIFSFFGLTKKDETEEDQEQLAPPEPAKPAPNTRPTLIIDKTSLQYPRDKDLPEIRRWWQNSDGSITGYIYNSKNFNDGTKLTTSPLQRAASKKGNVVRSGGTDYLLN